MDHTLISPCQGLRSTSQLDCVCYSRALGDPLQQLFQGSLEWMYELSEKWELPPKRPQFELVVNNPKHPGELFNCTE